MPLAPYQPITLPERSESALTILDVADVRREGEDGVDHKFFTGGVAFRPQLCNDATFLDPNDNPKARPDGDPVPDEIGCEVFSVDMALVSPSAGDGDLVAEVEAALDLATPKAIEAQLWRGGWTSPDDREHQSLTRGIVAGDGLVTADVAPTELNGGAAFAAGAGLAGILDGIASCGDSTARYIHATPGTVDTWVAADGVEAGPDGLLRTTVGSHIVIPGAGYPGSSPAGAAPAAGTAWVYITHQPVIWISNAEIHDGPSPRHARNGRSFEPFVRLWAQRDVVIAFDPCCHQAALVTLG